MNAGDAQTRRFSVELSVDARYVRVARLFAAAVARHFGCPEDVIADVKLAVSEAVSAGVEEESGPIHLTVEHERGALSFSVSPAGGSSPDTADDASGNGLSMALIRAIFEDAKVEETAGARPVLRFSVPLGEEAPRPDTLSR